MFVRLTLADVKEGEMNNALESVSYTHLTLPTMYTV